MGYRVIAHNTASGSTNRIHDDEVARQFGFRGGLVPGVDVYAYLCHLPAERWGRPWLERGTMAARFEAPVYDGDEVEVEGHDGEGGFDLTLRDAAGAVCATGRATLPGRPAAVPDEQAWPAGRLPSEPPIAGPEAFRAAPFGRVEAHLTAEVVDRYLDDVREWLPLFREERLVHPGWLLRRANGILMANVRLGPWIHVESSTQHLGVFGEGGRVETRALVTGVSERSGHRFVELDVLHLADEGPVARTTHVAIYQPRARRAAPLPGARP